MSIKHPTLEILGLYFHTILLSSSYYLGTYQAKRLSLPLKQHLTYFLKWTYFLLSKTSLDTDILGHIYILFYLKRY